MLSLTQIETTLKKELPEQQAILATAFTHAIVDKLGELLHVFPSQFMSLGVAAFYSAWVRSLRDHLAQLPVGDETYAVVSSTARDIERVTEALLTRPIEPEPSCFSGGSINLADLMDLTNLSGLSTPEPGDPAAGNSESPAEEAEQRSKFHKVRES